MTTLTRWNPFREMEDMLDRFGSSLTHRSRGHSEGGQESMTIADWAPAVDIAETAGEYQIKVELPEVRKEDVKVSVHQGVLSIQGERKVEREEKDKKYHRIERSYGSFVRSFTLPEGVDEESVRARFKDGMLYVDIDKAEEARPRSIDVKIS